MTPHSGRESDGSAPAAGVVTADLHCIRCGYNLRTLRWDAACPECAAPVRAAALLTAEFRLRSRQEANRLRRGLSLLIISVLISTTLTVALTIVISQWWWFTHGGYGRYLRPAVQTWTYGEFVADAIRFAAIVLIVWPTASMHDGRGPAARWHAAAILLAFIALVTDVWVIGSRLSSRGFAAGRPYSALLACAALAPLGPAAFVMAWRIAAGLVRPAGGRMLRTAGMLGTYAAAVAGVPEAANRLWKYVTYCLEPATGPTVPSPVSLWVWHALDPVIAARQHVGGACWIVMAAAAWVYLRRLKAVMRS